MTRSMILAALVASAPLALGCSLGQGTGDVKSDALFARDCWGRALDATHAQGAPYDMLPDFFATVPYRNTQQIRVQRGTDYTEVSDGIMVLIDDVEKIRAAVARAQDAPDAGESSAGATFRVAISAGVAPAGSPSQPPQELIDDPPIVHLSFYLQRSCHNQNTILYAVDGSVTFHALFSGDPNETSAEEKLTDAEFDVEVGDLRDTPFGEYAGNVPEGLRSRISGKFRFYFERGQPGQPFP
jgi:hypothetical protein